MRFHTKSKRHLNSKTLGIVLTSLLFSISGYSQSTGSNPLSVSGFALWVSRSDSATKQLIPRTGKNSLTMEGGKTVAHVRFKVNGYAEMSLPISPRAIPNVEPPPVNLTASRFIKIRYKANQPMILQLRQAGAQDSVHNHVLLPACADFTTATVPFSSFKGGLQPLDLRNVALFNFAFTANNKHDGFADLIVQSFTIDRYKP